IMRLYRTQPQQLTRLQALHDASDSAERVLHPSGAPQAYPNAATVGAGLRSGQLVEPPAAPRLARLGLAFAMPPGPARALRPAALSALLYVGVGTRDVAGP